MNMGTAAMEAEEHRQQMFEDDLKAGHKPGCGISYPNPGRCTCGLYTYDEPKEKVETSKVPRFRFGFYPGLIVGATILYLTDFIF